MQVLPKIDLNLKTLGNSKKNALCVTKKLSHNRVEGEGHRIIEL